MIIYRFVGPNSDLLVDILLSKEMITVQQYDLFMTMFKTMSWVAPYNTLTLHNTWLPRVLLHIEASEIFGQLGLCKTGKGNK